MEISQEKVIHKMYVEDIALCFVKNLQDIVLKIREDVLRNRLQKHYEEERRNVYVTTT